MQRRVRRKHTPAFKAKVALAAVKGDRTLAQRVEAFDVHPDERLFLELDQARQIVAAWVADSSTTRPHSSVGYRMPVAYADHLIAPKGVSTTEAPIAAG